MRSKVRRTDLYYPDLSYEIVGCAFDVQNELGFGHLEKTYGKALAVKFKNKGIKFQTEVYNPVRFEGERVGYYYFDFLVEGKIIVELKCGTHFSKADFQQISNYLAVSKKKLAILLTFTKDGVLMRRVVNDFDRESVT